MDDSQGIHGRAGEAGGRNCMKKEIEKMRLGLCLTVALGALSAIPAAAQSMNAEEFLERATKLEKKGVMALMAKDRKPLERELVATMKQLSEERRAVVAGGRTPAYCPPEGGKLGAQQYLRLLRAVPQAERRRMTLRQATVRAFAIEYPC